MTEPSIGAPPEHEPITEFGGRFGVLGIMIGSHLLLYWLWIAWRFEGGAMPLPHGLADLGPFCGRMLGHVVTDAAPTLEAVAVYGTFVGVQAALMAWLPGLKVFGLPIPSRGNTRLEYTCNGIWAWYATLILVAVAHFSGAYPLTRVWDQFGSLMTVAILAGDLIAVATYVGAVRTGTTHRMSGSLPYDFFMGAPLNPRLGRLDLKMWAEIRIAWILLFLLTLSAAAHQFATFGTVSTPMIFMLTAHGLYTNACMKGEECIPTTWDIFYEKWGWMLIFWNFAGVPFVYAFSSAYLASRPPFEHAAWFQIGLFLALLGAYYVWDTSQSQRNRFRMMERGTFIKRRAFPQLPWGTLKNPRYLETASGSKLLTDGWWRYARKIHYSCDVVMALSWGLVCGTEHFLPYFYVTFFVGMIGHRAHRDIQRCRAKYGDDWDRYCAEVPHLFIPGVF